LNSKSLVITMFLLVLVWPVAGMAKVKHTEAEPLAVITPILSDDEPDPSMPILSPTPTFIPTAIMTPTSLTTATKTVTPTPQHKAAPKATPVPTKKGDANLPKITVIPNPARGTKVTFRVMTGNPVEVRLKVYNRFYDAVAELKGEGDHLFDILWSLKGVPEGPYSYQAQVIDKTTGQFSSLPLQKFTIEKDETPPDN
jgi:hypothetical protein